MNVKVGSGRKNKRKEPVHKLVLFAFHGPKPTPDHQCRHLNGNPFDNSLDNLAWGTAEENAQDSIRHGTHPSLRLGEERNCSKLTEKDVIEINSLVHQGAKQSEFARRYGVCQRHISDIKLKRTWKHLRYPQGEGKSLVLFP